MPRSTPSTDYFTISQLAGELDISTRSIRFYEEKGLITPRRTRGNQRTYSRRDRARLRLILRGKRFGYSLKEIGEMIGHTDLGMSEAEQIRKSLQYGEKKMAEIRTHIEELEQLENDLNDVKNKLIRRLREIENGDAPRGAS